MTNYIKLLPNLIIAFNCCYCNPQNATVLQNNSVQPMITTNLPNSQQIVPTQQDNTGLQTSFPQNSALQQQNTVIPNKHNALPLQRSATANVPNSNSIQILNNNPQTIQQNNAEVSKPIQQTKQISKVNTMTPQSKSNIIKQTSPVNQILPAKKFTNQSNSAQKLNKTINRTTSLGTTSKSSKLLENVQQLRKTSTINTSTHNIEANNLASTLVAENENKLNEEKWMKNQVHTLEDQMEGNFFRYDHLNKVSQDQSNYYKVPNTSTLNDEQKVIISKMYKIMSINIQELKKSFTNILKSDTNNKLIFALEHFNRDILYKLCNSYNDVLNDYTLTIIGRTVTDNNNPQNTTAYPASLIKTLADAIAHKESDPKKKDKEKYTLSLLKELLGWFSKIPYANTQNEQLGQTSLSEFISKIKEHYLSLPVFGKVK